jgi:organic radical activating enzyme
MQYNVIEIFKSIQGEGANTGKEVVFIRFAGCNLSCPWCDTDQSKSENLSLEQVISLVFSLNCNNVILTGGEPLIQVGLLELALELKGYRFWVGMETNGTISIPPELRQWIDYIAVSPKPGAKTELRRADEMRIVVSSQCTEDFCKMARSITRADRYFLSPCEVDGKFNILETITLLGKLNAKERCAKWLMSIQTHKLAGIR